MQKGRAISNKLQKQIARMNTARRRADPVGAFFGDLGREIKKFKPVSNILAPAAASLASAIPKVGMVAGPAAGALVGSIGQSLGLGKRRRGGKKGKTGGKKRKGGKKSKSGGKKRSMVRAAVMPLRTPIYRAVNLPVAITSRAPSRTGTGRRRGGRLSMPLSMTMVRQARPVFKM